MWLYLSSAIISHDDLLRPESIPQLLPHETADFEGPLDRIDQNDNSLLSGGVPQAGTVLSQQTMLMIVHSCQ
jgi:hypothetical protein